jgi:hypothetical protein
LGKEMLEVLVGTHLTTQVAVAVVLALLVQVQLGKLLDELVVLAFSGLMVLFTQAVVVVVLTALLRG